MRGTLAQVGHLRPQAGIIPAYAGNTSRTTTAVAGRRDHPRVCGEHEWHHHQIPGLRGSSPRMRGTPPQTLPPMIRTRIIPAYAGNTCRNVRLPANRRDHPRVCGEHRSRVWTRLTRAGSSPRMRGTRFGMRPSRDTGRIIPAYAGNTMAVMFSRIEVRDHPRVCGEHAAICSCAVTSTGSSPRMRGTRVLRPEPGIRTGIIPAYAGNTLVDHSG